MSALTGIIFVAIVTSVGWAVRGEWGNWWGETVPGALAGMAIWIAFGDSGSAWQMIGFGAALSIAHTVGGEISYGQIVSYVVSRRSLMDPRKTDPENRSPIYGLLALFAVGGMIGLFPSAALGLLMTDISYSTGDLAVWAILAVTGAIVFYRLVVTGIGFRLSPPRYDYWAATMGASIATVLYFHLYAGDVTVLLTCALGWTGYGLGFSVGGLIHRHAYRAGLGFDSWKWMEHSVGLFGGLALGTSASLMGESLITLQMSPVWKLASLIVIAFFVPYLILTDVFEEWTFRMWEPGTARSRSLLESGSKPILGGEGWRRITSRRVYATFQLLSLASLTVALMVFDRLISSWDGRFGGRTVFTLLLILYVFVGILKFLPIQRDRSKLITQGTFLAFVAVSIGILQFQ